VSPFSLILIHTFGPHLRLAWTEANTWFRAPRCLHPLGIACVSGDLPLLCTGVLWIPVALSFTRVPSDGTRICFSSFHWYPCIFLKSMCVVSADVNDYLCLISLGNHIEEILALKVILASYTEQCTYCLLLWCTFRILLDNKLLLRSGHPAAESCVIVRAPTHQSLMDEK